MLCDFHLRLSEHFWLRCLFNLIDAAGDAPSRILTLEPTSPFSSPTPARRHSVKYEEVYLRAYESVFEARTSIGRYLDFYNGRRPHSSLDGTTPDQAYFTPLPLRLAA